MEAKPANLLRFLQHDNQFVIPIYQRTYSWTHEQCKQLWDDIVRAGMGGSEVPSHFLGSVVYLHESTYQTSSVPQLVVIDGQQRLTTITLLIVAIRNLLSKGKLAASNPDVTPRKIDNRYLLNDEEADDLRYKLILTQDDRTTLLSLVDGASLPEHTSQRVIDNYEFFFDRIVSTKVEADTLWDGISKLLIVDISLERGKDNPQLIFESLNSTGLDLTQADLIRNYVLMDQQPGAQTRLYNEYWHPMERKLPDVRTFNRFMRDYLTIKSQAGAIPKEEEVYIAFKVYRQIPDAPTVDSILSDLLRYSDFYARLAFGHEKDQEINQVIADINSMRVNVAFPFLLEVYDDYDRKVISRSDFLSILRLVESYVFRRAICDLTTRPLNYVFATLSKQIDKSRYLESTQAALLLKEGNTRFPRDEEFISRFVHRDAYHFGNSFYLLNKLENYKRKEKLNIYDPPLTREHIMPQNQNLSAEWQKELGENWQEIQSTYLHTIGNITLTGYNSELGDRPFTDKRTMIGGFKDSSLRLNRYLSELDHWNVDEILKRAYALGDIALSLWPCPDIPATALQSHRRARPIIADNTTTLDQYLEAASKEKQDLFHKVRARILGLDPEIQEIVFREKPTHKWPDYHISYINISTFCDVVLQSDRIRIVLNIKPDQLRDPQNMGRDVSGDGYYGGGDVRIYLRQDRQLDYVTDLIAQAYDIQSTDDD